MTLSVAGLRYRNVLAKDGGPVAGLAVEEMRLGGEVWHQANATLQPALRSRRKNCVYSNEADGTGVHPTAVVAMHMAISEAMERWAYHDTVRSESRSKFAFDVDPTSNGMAAFPGLFARQARRSAYLEALERVCLFRWWEGHMDGYVIDTDWPGVRALIIKPPSGGFVAITFMKTVFGNHAYGHAADVSLTTACTKAMVEMNRHDRVVRRYYARCIGQPQPTGTLERRALFFASEAGFAVFNERIQRKKWMPDAPLDLLCDREIPGPWSRYATVWRVAYQPPSEQFLNGGDAYFFL